MCVQGHEGEMGMHGEKGLPGREGDRVSAHWLNIDAHCKPNCQYTCIFNYLQGRVGDIGDPGKVGEPVSECLLIML